MKHLLTLLALFVPAIVWAEPLKAHIEETWTVDSAREEAFRNAQANIDVSHFPPIDPNLIANREAINVKKWKIVLKQDDTVIERYITVFDDNSYAVKEIKFDIEIIRLHDKSFSFYYSSNGELHAIDLDLDESVLKASDLYAQYGDALFENKELIKKASYPQKGYKYCYSSCNALGLENGGLMSVAITVDSGNEYIFDTNGTLLAHWVGNKCYRANGSSCGTRKTLKERI